MDIGGIKLKITKEMKYNEKVASYEFFVRHYGFEIYFQIMQKHDLTAEDKELVTLEQCINYARSKYSFSSIMDIGTTNSTHFVTEHDLRCVLDNKGFYESLVLNN